MSALRMEFDADFRLICSVPMSLAVAKKLVDVGFNRAALARYAVDRSRDQVKRGGGACLGVEIGVRQIRACASIALAQVGGGQRANGYIEDGGAVRRAVAGEDVHGGQSGGSGRRRFDEATGVGRDRLDARARAVCGMGDIQGAGVRIVADVVVA